MSSFLSPETPPTSGRPKPARCNTVVYGERKFEYYAQYMLVMLFASFFFCYIASAVPSLRFVLLRIAPASAYSVMPPWVVVHCIFQRRRHCALRFSGAAVHDLPPFLLLLCRSSGAQTRVSGLPPVRRHPAKDPYSPPCITCRRLPPEQQAGGRPCLKGEKRRWAALLAL